MFSFPANICLQHVFSVTILRLPRRLEDVLQRRFEDVLKTSCKTSWRRLGRQNIVTLRHVLKTSWRHVLKTFWRHVLKTSSRSHVEKQKVYWGYLYLKKCKCVSNKSVFPKSISDETKANRKRINLNQIISIFVFFLNSSSISISRIKTYDDCSVLWNQLYSNSTLQNTWGNKKLIFE